MAEQAASLATTDLQLASLELEIKSIHINREEDRKEFQEFHTMVNRNFATMQGNFDKIQENFRRLLVEPGSDEGQVERSEQGSAQVSMGQDHKITFQDETVPSSQPEETKDKVQTLMDQAVCGFVLFTACAVDTTEVGKELPAELHELQQDYELLF
ncbi:hypothetical protein D1007_11883 [Hordeum vulgare]|nr:hypothetical protein D1007_11883 [Hordeum vulgare]